MKFTKLQKLQLNHSRKCKNVAVGEFVGELCNSEVRNACLSSYFIYDPRDHPQSEIDSITCEPSERKNCKKAVTSRMPTHKEFPFSRGQYFWYFMILNRRRIHFLSYLLLSDFSYFSRVDLYV